MRDYGMGFPDGSAVGHSDPNTSVIRHLPPIWGTLYSSLLAFVSERCSASPSPSSSAKGCSRWPSFRLLKVFGVQFHRFWGQLSRPAEDLLQEPVELLAAIPSVVYGLWGIFVVIPALARLQRWPSGSTGGRSSAAPVVRPNYLSGPGCCRPSLVLAIMVLPTITAISPRRARGRAAEAAGGGVRPGRHALGSRSWRDRAHALHAASSARSSWPSAARSARHGAGHARRQRAT